MKRTVKTRWIKRLRSGRNKQCRQTLISHEGNYCCLGILCNVYLQEKSIRPRNLKARIEKIRTLLSLDREGYQLNSSMLKWSGLTQNNVAVLVKYNDMDRLSFKQIADRIEKLL